GADRPRLGRRGGLRRRRRVRPRGDDGRRAAAGAGLGPRAGARRPPAAPELVHALPAAAGDLGALAAAPDPAAVARLVAGLRRPRRRPGRARVAARPRPRDGRAALLPRAAAGHLPRRRAAVGPAPLPPRRARRLP